MNLRQIEVFRAVMLAGSVTDAARLLHVSQPGVSRMIGHIELQLGLSLFERRKGRLVPTPEAQALYAEVAEVYGGLRRVGECARELRHGARLSLRVLASPSAGLLPVPRALAALAHEYPAAKLYVETLPAREMVGRLLRREADIAVSNFPIDNALLASRALDQWRLVCVFPAGHRFAAKRRLQPRDVLQEPLVTFSADTPQGVAVAAWCERHGMAARTSIEVRAGQMACALAANGAGVAVVDDLSALACRSPQLDFRPMAGSEAYDVCAVTHAGFAPSQLANRFVALVGEALKVARKG